MAGQAEKDMDKNPVGQVVTVTGPVEPDRLGQTIMHEHIYVDLRKTHLPHVKMMNEEGRIWTEYTEEDIPATDLALWEAKLDFGNLHLARDVQPIADNYLLTDEELAKKEVLEFKKYGGGTIVDVTSIGLKRAPLALRRLSEATGLNVVMGTGWYQKLYHPADMAERAVESIADNIVRDVTVGVGGTGVRAGIIGEIGVNGNPIEPNEFKSIRAAAQASRRTGAAISFHKGGAGAERHDTLTAVAEEGGDLTRVIMGHSDELALDLPFMKELLDRGVWIQFDLMGREEALVPSITARVAEGIPKLIDAGYEDRILLSHDICWKVHLKHYGGFGYSYLLEKFLPHLRTVGVSEAQIDKMMVQNPKKVLPLVEPK